MDVVYRIYTEDADRETVIDIVATQFDNFTLHETTGYYKEKPSGLWLLRLSMRTNEPWKPRHAPFGPLTDKKPFWS
jgi:hypothetical protein